MSWTLVLSIFVGAGLGLAWQQLVGCRTGTCPITSNAWVSTIYGALLGYLVSGGIR